MELESIPVNSVGKIDRKRLPLPQDEWHQKAEYTAARTETEAVVVKIWEELLGVQRIGIYDNFFELGGHSLLVMRIIAKIKAELEVNIPVKYLFELTDVEKIAAFIDVQLAQRNSISEEYQQIII